MQRGKSTIGTTTGPIPSAGPLYYGGTSAATRRYLAALESLGQQGRIAAGLFRVAKAPVWTTAPRGDPRVGDHRGLSWGRRVEAMRQLCVLLADDPAGLVWGWTAGPCHQARHVLLVQLPTGLVAIQHCVRGDGPDWSSPLFHPLPASPRPILRFCDSLLLASPRLTGWVAPG